VHDKVEVPKAPRVTLVAPSVQPNPVTGETDDVKVTVPANELIEATLITEVPAALAIVVTLVGLAVTEKSGTATV
jgi:hypothetical protein